MRKFFTPIATLLIIFFSTPCTAQEELVLSGLESPRSKVTFQILREAYSSLGIEVKFKPYPILRSTHSAHSGAVDGELFKVSGVDGKFPNLIRVPVPIDNLDIMVMAQKEAKVKVTWESLRDLRVGYYRGVFFIENKISTEGIMSARGFETNEQLIKMVSLNRLDVGLIARIVGIKTLKKSQVDNVKLLPQPIETVPVYHYLNIKHTALVPKLTNILEQMNKSGRIKMIRAKILSEELKKHN